PGDRVRWVISTKYDMRAGTDIFPGYKQEHILCHQRRTRPDHDSVGDLGAKGAGICRGDDVQVAIVAPPAQVEATLEGSQGGSLVGGLSQSHFLSQDRRIGRVIAANIEAMIVPHPCYMQITAKIGQTGSLTHQDANGKPL